MESSLLIGLALILVLGIGAQWISWRLGMPAILLLLVFGFLAGPVWGWVDPDRLFGELLFPIVSISVGLILFEGGLSLRLSDLKEIGADVAKLILIGSVVTWLGASAAAVYVLGLDVRLAALLGAVLVVTGPTVIIPLLRQVRPAGQVGSILKWESILIDPLGATLALLVFEAILVSEVSEAASEVAAVIAKTIGVAAASGALGAVLMIQMVKRYWAPDFLQNSVALMIVVGAFAASNIFQEESGLLAVTIMGVVLANQKSAEISHIVEFKENLRVLLISSLFIILASRLKLSDLTELPLASFAFLGLLIFAIRPLAVGMATLGSKMSWRERAFLAWLAPRGIVAAAVSSVFALRLADSGVDIPQAELLAPMTFMVIVGTVVIYGFTAGPVARRLGVAQPEPQGVLFVGAQRWARDIALKLKEKGFDVLMADTNWDNVSAARLAGLPAYFGNVLSEQAADEIELGGLGRLVALTANNEVNSLAALHFSDVFGRSEIYQLPSDAVQSAPKQMVSRRLSGRRLFAKEMTYERLSRLFAEGGSVKTTPLTKEFDFDRYCSHYGEGATALILVAGGNKLRPFTIDDPPKPAPGDVVLSLVMASAEKRDGISERHPANQDG